MTMLLTLIFLWLCAVATAFLIKIFKSLSAVLPATAETSASSEIADDEPDIIGGVRTSGQNEPLLSAVPSSDEILSGEDGDISDEYELDGFSFDENRSADDSVDSCSLDELQTYHDTMTAQSEAFEERIGDPQKLSALMRTGAKLENSVYYNKLKENKDFETRSSRLSDIAKERYGQHLQRLLAENTIEC